MLTLAVEVNVLDCPAVRLPKSMLAIDTTPTDELTVKLIVPTVLAEVPTAIAPPVIVSEAMAIATRNLCATIVEAIALMIRGKPSKGIRYCVFVSGACFQ